MTRLAEKPFALIGVNGGGRRAAKELKEVMQREKITWRSFVDTGAIFQRWTTATPTYYAIDHRGVIRYRWAGNPGEKSLEAALERLLEKAP